MSYKFVIIFQKIENKYAINLFTCNFPVAPNMVTSVFLLNTGAPNLRTPSLGQDKAIPYTASDFLVYLKFYNVSQRVPLPSREPKHFPVAIVFIFIIKSTLTCSLIEKSYFSVIFKKEE